MKKYISLGGAIALGSFVGLTNARKEKADTELAYYCASNPWDPICPTYAAQVNAKPAAVHHTPAIEESEVTSCDDDVEAGIITGMVRARHIDYSLDVRENDEDNDLIASVESLGVERRYHSLSPAVNMHHDSPYSAKVKHTFADCPENCGVINWNDGRAGFHCWDWADDMCKQCVLVNNDRYQCWDGVEWEWANQNENDYTPDNSPLTSLETDGIYGTSPSEDFDDLYYVQGIEEEHNWHHGDQNDKQESTKDEYVMRQYEYDQHQEHDDYSNDADDFEA